MDYHFWKEHVVEFDLSDDGKVDFDYHNAEIDAKLKKYFAYKYSPTEAYRALKTGEYPKYIGDVPKSVIVRQEVKHSTKLRYPRPKFGLTLTIAIIFISIAFYLFHNDTRKQTEELRKQKQEFRELFEAYEYLETHRAIPELTSYYRGYCIWVRARGRKYYVSSFGQGFESKREARQFVDKLWKLYEEYKKKSISQIPYRDITFPIAKQIEKDEKGISISIKKYIAYFNKFDDNGDGQLSWAEIINFQERVFKEFIYRNNDIVLTPEQFYEAKGGDCDDFAVFSASFLNHFGYSAYLVGFKKQGALAGHEVAALFIGDSTFPGGFIKINNRKLYKPKTCEEISESAPNGNYVILDYWKIGTSIEAYDGIDMISTIEDTIGAKM